MDNNGIALLLVGGSFYLLPTLFAGARSRHNTGAIFALNLFLGWSVIGWVIAMVWALSSDQPAQADPRKMKKCPACAELIKKDARKCRFCGEPV